MTYARTYYPYHTDGLKRHNLAEIEAMTTGQMPVGIRIFGIDDEFANQQLASKLKLHLMNLDINPNQSITINIIADVWLDDDPNIELPMLMAAIAVTKPGTLDNIINRAMFSGEVKLNGEIRTNQRGYGYKFIDHIDEYTTTLADCDGCNIRQIINALEMIYPGDIDSQQIIQIKQLIGTNTPTLTQ